MKPSFIFLPGLHGTCGPFAAIKKIMGARSIDLPKEGPQDYGTLSTWLNSQRFPKSYILVGESFSGPLALLHASRHPRGLKAVALLGSFAHIGLPLSSLLSYLIPPLPLASPFFQKIIQRRLFSGEASPAQLEFFKQEASHTPPAIFRARFQQVMRCDVRACLPQIEVPVLSVRATRDQMVPDRAEDGLKGIRDLRQVRINAPHVIAGTRPRELAKILNELCRRLLHN